MRVPPGHDEAAQGTERQVSQPRWFTGKIVAVGEALEELALLAKYGMCANALHLRDANDFVAQHHRHSLPTIGGKFAVGAADDEASWSGPPSPVGPSPQ